MRKGRSAARRCCLRASAALVILLLVTSGCGDDPQPDAVFLLVKVAAEATGVPVAGVKVLLMDADTNRPLAGPVVSDAAGLCRLEPAAGGRRRLLVVGGPLWAVHDQPDWYGSLLTSGGQPVTGALVAGDGRAILTALTEPAPAPAVVNLVLVRPRRSPGGLPRFSGTVVDADSGLPLDQAFVSLSPWPTGYGGGAAVSDDVTGADGSFAVHDIPIAMNVDTGVGFQVLPLIVSRAGYRTARFVHEPPGGIDHPEVQRLVIALAPLDDTAGGGLSGRVVRGGLPVAGLAVGLGVFPGARDATDTKDAQDAQDAKDLKGAIGVPGQATVTGADGRFRFTDLPPGTYVIHPGFLVGDGAWYGGGLPAQAVTVGADTDAGDLTVLHEIAPAAGNPSRLAATDTIVTFHWTPTPGAARYGWFLDGGLLAEAEVESVTVTLPALAVGLHAWQTSAVDAEGQAVGVMQNDAWFRRDPP